MIITVPLSEIYKGFDYAGFDPTVVFRIYIIKGEGVILYVGRSKEAIDRVETHCGIGRFGSGTLLTNHLLSNRKKIMNYTVTFLDEEICCSLSKYKDVVRIQKNRYWRDTCVEDLENRLIFRLSPVYNAMGQKEHRREINRWNELYPPEQTWWTGPDLGL